SRELRLPPASVLTPRSGCRITPFGHGQFDRSRYSVRQPLVDHSINPREITTMDRNATAVWKGNLKEGKGTLTTQSGALSNLAYSFKGRFEDESGKSGTNPEELLAAAHAGCFAMPSLLFLPEKRMANAQRHRT